MRDYALFESFAAIFMLLYIVYIVRRDNFSIVRIFLIINYDVGACPVVAVLSF